MLGEKFQIVFSLFYWAEWERVLPQAFIVPESPTGKLQYYVAQAKRENVNDYGFALLMPALDKALHLVDELHPKNIEQYFLAKRKKKASIQQLLADKTEKKLFTQYIDQRMSAFLGHCAENQLILCWELERKIRVDDVRLLMLPFEAKAQMSFSKTVTGVQYSLFLKVADQSIQPNQHQVIILNENPAWVSIDQKIIKINGLPGIRLKPFVQKESLFIPDTHTKEFFEKFVVENLQNVEVEAKGFDHHIVQAISCVRLRMRDVFTENRFALELIFYYQDIVFSCSDPALYRNKIYFEGERVSVREYRRDPEEEGKYVELMTTAGFEISGNKLFYSGKSRYDTLHHLKKVSDKLGTIQFDQLLWESKTFLLSPVTWHWDVTMENDWFDIKAEFFLDGNIIPFKDLIPYIKRNDPFFPVGQSGFVIIPDELMTKLSDILSFATFENDKICLPKSRHALLEGLTNSEGKDVWSGEMSTAEDIPYQMSENLKATLRPYQIQGVKWMLAHRQNGLGCLLADDMGLGKTLQVIALLTHVKETKKNQRDSMPAIGQQLDLFAPQERMFTPVKALVVLPASLVFNWQSECKKFAPFLHVATFTGPGRKKLEKTLHTFDVILTTYKTVVTDLHVLSKVNFEYVILDESQAIKNKDSLTFKSLNALEACHKISLSGTPIENSLSELWSQMQFINPDVLGSFSFFEKNFLIPIQKQNDDNKKEVLRTLAEPYLLRRTKFQVAPELPAISRQTHYSLMDTHQASAYEKSKSAIRNAILDEEGKFKVSRTHVLVSLLRLRQIASHPSLAEPAYEHDAAKFDDVKAEIMELQEAGHKVLVFSSFTSMLDMYCHWAEKNNISHVVLTGESSPAQRKEAVESFQANPDITVFFISLKAGGVGLNLTSADYVFILDPWWNPAVEEQAIARAHRIGREGTVFVKKFITKDTIEEKILKLQEKKKNLAKEFILENSMPENWDEDDIRLLLS